MCGYEKSEATGVVLESGMGAEQYPTPFVEAGFHLDRLQD
jgi:hypothetical protein